MTYINRRLSFSREREQPCGCLRPFFLSTGFDNILCCILGNIVEISRIFLSISANISEFHFILKKISIYLQFVAERTIVPALRPRKSEP